MTGFDIEITIKSIRDRCDFGHKVGEKIYYNGYTFKGKICPTALAALMPTLYAFCFGAEFPWDKKRDITHFTCPDGNGQVKFELKRLRKKPWLEGLKICH